MFVKLCILRHRLNNFYQTNAKYSFKMTKYKIAIFHEYRVNDI